MSYISGLSAIVKGERGEFYFNKDQFLFATNFASNPYFADELNWAKIAVYYKDATSNQKLIIILKDDNGRGWFAPSEMARTGSWSVDKIEVYDKQGDFFVVSRSNMPVPETFDVSVQRIIAPSSPVVQLVENQELILDGGFETNPEIWSRGGFTNLTYNNMEAVLSNNEASSVGMGLNIFQPVAVEAGQRYRASVLYPALTANENAHIKALWAEGVYNQTFSAMQVASNKTLETFFVAENTSVEIDVGIVNLTAGSLPIGARTFRLDNVSLKKVPSQLLVEMGQGEYYEVGYKVKLWDTAANGFLTEDIYTITDIQLAFFGQHDKITFDKQIQGNYVGKTLVLRFPSYSQVTGKQASLYQYVGSGY